jgi:hypothetical protein
MSTLLSVTFLINHFDLFGLHMNVAHAAASSACVHVQPA